ncbi:MAG TPA: hypothetical protein VE441_17235, partial [Mycobacterium sp.]|nr:hypothetical protein [Mycobacterium sp.]
MSVSWQLATPDLTHVAALVVAARAVTAHVAGKSDPYACLTKPALLQGEHGRMSETFESPCGHDGAVSPFVPKRVSARPAPAGGRTLTTATWLGTSTQEEWTVQYTTAASAASPAVAAAVRSATLQQLAAKSIYGTSGTGGPAVGPAELPKSWQGADQVRRPRRDAPGASAVDPCQLVAAADVAAVPQMPPFVGTAHAHPTGAPAGVCNENYTDKAKSSSGPVPFSGAVQVGILPGSLKRYAPATGVVGASHGIATYTTLEQLSDPADFQAAVFLAAGPDTTVWVAYTGQHTEISAWDQQVVAAVSDHVAQRLATGQLAPKVPVVVPPQRGVVAANLQYGNTDVNSTGTAVCALVPNLKSITHSAMHTNPAGYFPPICESTKQIPDADGPTPRVMVSLYDGHSIEEEIQRGSASFPGEVGIDVFTRVVSGVTVVVGTQMPFEDQVMKGLTAHDDGTASAAIANSQTQWIEVSVHFVDKSD